MRKKTVTLGLKMTTTEEDENDDYESSRSQDDGDSHVENGDEGR